MMRSVSGKTGKLYDENPNIDWAMRFVDELARGGLTAVCIAPGSRSTPLALSFYTHPGIRVFEHLDERSASFFALGMALAEAKPVALVCTSGTATANFHPAIIEAQMSQVPLLILTADRPHELRHSGANQTIDQIKMFGDHVLWSVDVALPQANAPKEVIRSLRTLAAQALAQCNGFVKGPVHLNFPFRKPLEPHDLDNWSSVVNTEGTQEPTTRIEHGCIQPTQLQIDHLAERISQHAKGLIICGPRCPTGNFPAAVALLAEKAGYPILADPLSGIRFSSPTITAPVIGAYETFLQSELAAELRPELIIRFGSVPTSKWLNHYLNKQDVAYHLHIQESGKWADQNHTTTHVLQVNPALLCQQLVPAIRHPTDINWQKQWQRLEKESWSIINRLLAVSFDGALVANLLELLPPGTRLFSGNSLSIRHIDQFGQPLEKDLSIYANRGASGIDGNISTGLGIAATTNQLTVLLVGDITFYHDSNGLLALKEYGLGNVIIVLLNNNGGGIFRRLPIARVEPPFRELFLTPHDLDFASLAAAYGINYQAAVDLTAFRKVFGSALTAGISTIIEFRTDSLEDDQQRRRIVDAVKSQIDRSLAKKPESN